MCGMKKLNKKPTFLIGSFVLSLAVPTGFEPAMRIGIIKRLVGNFNSLINVTEKVKRS